MSQPEKQLTEKESLDLITQMINKAKNSYHDTGVGAMMWGAVLAWLIRGFIMEKEYRLYKKEQTLADV